jgi:hypothetical protein
VLGVSFVAVYAGRPAEVRRTEDGALLATLSAAVDVVRAGPGTGARRFAVTYRDAPGEVWEEGDRPRRLAELGTGIEELFFGPQGRRLVLWYSDGRVDVAEIE